MTVVIVDHQQMIADRKSLHSTRSTGVLDESILTKIFPLDTPLLYEKNGNNYIKALAFSGDINSVDRFVKALLKRISPDGSFRYIEPAIEDILDDQIRNPDFELILFGSQTHTEYDLRNGRTTIRELDRTNKNKILAIGSGWPRVKTFKNLSDSFTTLELAYLACISDTGCGGGLSFYNELEGKVTHRKDITPKQREKIAAKVHKAIISADIAIGDPTIQN